MRNSSYTNRAATAHNQKQIPHETAAAAKRNGLADRLFNDMRASSRCVRTSLIHSRETREKKAPNVKLLCHSQFKHSGRISCVLYVVHAQMYLNCSTKFALCAAINFYAWHWAVFIMFSSHSIFHISFAYRSARFVYRDIIICAQWM